MRGASGRTWRGGAGRSSCRSSAAAVVAAAAFSPPGRAVVDAVRRTIGVEHAAPALFRLPAPGRLLVSGAGGTWVVVGRRVEAASRRRGAGVVVAARALRRRRERRHARGGRAGARHGALVARAAGRLVPALGRHAGRHADRVSECGASARRRAATAPATSTLAPAARASRRRGGRSGTCCAYATPRGGVAVVDADSQAVLAVHAARGARELAWSPDGKQLVAVTPRLVHIWSAAAPQLRAPRCRRAGGRVRARRPARAAARAERVRLRGGRGAATCSRAPGRLEGLAWSPNGRWLVTALPSADQWIFIGGRRRARRLEHRAAVRRARFA